MIPVKIKALNQDLSDDSNEEEIENPITKEALEQKLQLGYREALVLQKQNKLNEAENILLNLIENDVLRKTDGKVNYINGKLQPSIFHLKYCCYLNLGNISFKKGSYELALKYYSVATELDDTDLNLWYKIGKVAIEIPNLMFAVSAFMETLHRNPQHWPSLNSIITATYALGDFTSCLLYIHQALFLDHKYKKGLIFKERILDKHPHLKEDFYSLFPHFRRKNEEPIRIEDCEEDAGRYFQEVKELQNKEPTLNKTLFSVMTEKIPVRGLLKPLKSYSWLCLGKSLLKLYAHLNNNNDDDPDGKDFFAHINLKTANARELKKEIASKMNVISDQCGSCVVTSENNTVVGDLPFQKCFSKQNSLNEVKDRDGKLIVNVDAQNDDQADGGNRRRSNNASNEEGDSEEYSESNHGNDPDDGNEINGDDNDDNDVLKELNTISSKLGDGDKEPFETSHRSKKRKCSPTLADQLKFCDKRRSTRNKTVLKSNEPSLSKVLKTLIPTNLLPEKQAICKSNYFELARWNDDSFDTMDIYRLLFEHQDENNLASCPINPISESTRNRMLQEEKYFGGEKEKSDVEWYININNEQPILELMEVYLKDLSGKWSLAWPAKLADIFLEICQTLKKHGKNMQIIRDGRIAQLDHDSLKQSKDNLEMVVLFGELLLDQYFENTNKKLPLTGSIFGGSFCSLLIGEMRDACYILNLPETDIKLWMRTCWLEALLFLQEKNSYSSCSALTMLVDELAVQDIEVRLPNVRQFYVISQNNAKRLLNTLIRNENLNRVHALFSEKHFDSVIEILNDTLKPDDQQLVQIPNESTLSRYQQYTILLAALSEAKRYKELFEWCEVCCYESFAIYRKSFYDEIDTDMKAKWASLVMNTLNGMMWCLKNVGRSILKVLREERMTRLVQTLSSLVCHQIEATEPIGEITTSTVAPWILLCNIVHFNEKELNVNVDDDKDGEEVVIPSSVSLLFVAHEHLGKRCWCCFDDGALLFYTLDIIENMYKRSTMFTETWQTLGQQIDQIFYCLYSHPFKRNKPRYVQDHGSLGLALTWNRAVQTYSFYRPMQLPMFDAVSKHCTISADTETLLKRIIPLIPDEQNPARLLDFVNQYTNGLIDEIPIDENLLQSEVLDIFYLLGDYYFKNKIMGKAIKYYLLDVCFNRHRFDSWAAMALARGSQLEMKLNSCETIKSESDILKKAELADKCYKTALELDSSLSTLWIEYGVFCYSVHAFCSRLLKQETTNLSLQMFDTLENRKNEFLKTSFRSFNSANEAWMELTKKQEDVQDERWLHHYMLGKIAEKNEEKVNIYLGHYLKALQFLHQNGAEYPSRILYSSPQYYSVEALEMYYRIHATILKLLDAHEEKSLDRFVTDTLIKTADQMSKCAFAKAGLNYVQNYENEISNQHLTHEKIIEKKREEMPCHNNTENEVRQVLEDMLLVVANNGNDNDSSIVKRKYQDSASLLDDRKISKKAKLTDGIRLTENDDDVDVFNKNDKTAGSGSSANSPEKRDNESKIEKEGRSLSTSMVAVETAKWKNVQKKLTDRCVAALEECIKRFPEHYKSYYRLANHYFRSKQNRDIEKARKYLLEDGGLFADRKVSNFFNGIWRIPTGEIDRSGSFAFHMSRSVHLLVDVLRDTQDYKVLLNLSIQLRDTPELDKKYIRDNEREQICKEALSLSAQTLRKHIDNLSSMDMEENKRRLLLEVYKCYQRISKFYSQKDAPFGKILLAAFYKYTNRKDKVNLEQMLSFCKNLNVLSKEMWSATSLLTHGNENAKATAAPTINDVTAKIQALNHALTTEAKSHPNAGMLKAHGEQRMTIHPIPSNLKNLPSAITVTSIPKVKSTPTSSHPSLWNKNCGDLLKLKSAFSTSVKPNPHKEKKFKTDGKSKFASLSKSFLGEAKQSNQYRDVLATAAAKEKTNMKTKTLSTVEKSKIDKFSNPMAADKSLTITPVTSKVTAIDSPSSGFRNKSTTSIVKADTSVSLQERSSLIITPVDTVRSVQTLQQKLAAKQLANVPVPKNTNKHASLAATKHGSAPTIATKSSLATSFDISKNLGSSGVSIFPLPIIDSSNIAELTYTGGGGRLSNMSETQTSSSVPFHKFIPNASALLPGSELKYSPAFAANARNVKQTESGDVGNYKHYNKTYNSSATSASKISDEKLKNALKALEESSNIIITPKIAKPKSELEVITIE